MNTEQLRQSLKHKWLNYYAENRYWIARLQVWVNCDGKRRPSSGFILATLSVLEPQLNHLLPLIVDLSSNPDRIIAALGLNFNPDEYLEKLQKSQSKTSSVDSEPAQSIARPKAVKMLPASSSEILSPVAQSPSQVSRIDETCQGGRYRRKKSESK